MTAGKRILIVDDDTTLLEMLGEQLQLHEEFSTTGAKSATEALELAKEDYFDVIILDVGLPDMDGREVCRLIRHNGVTSPIIMLTGADTDADTILGLDAGANDYITKPFSPRELVARLKAVLRRATPRGVEDPIEINGLLLDPVSHRVSAHGKALEMGPTEYRLLQFFMTHQERAYTRSQLLDQVWGGNVYVEERTVDVHIRRLRKALGEAHQNLIQTVRGTGYRFSARV